MPTFKGRSDECKAPFLGAEFWKKGVSVKGKVIRTFKAANGLCYVLKAFQPIRLNGDSCEQVSIGGLRGVEMALQQAGVPRLLVGDSVHLECIGSTETQKGHPRLDFEIEISRPESPSPEIVEDEIPF